MAPPHVVGVDFSGARNAGRAIWIAAGSRKRNALCLRTCIPASALQKGDTRREPAIAALVDYIAALGDAAIGVDVPFGLPELLIGTDDWLDFVAGISERWPDPEAFRAGCRKAAGGRELRRHCDNEARTPFSPYNLRLYRQTWHAIADLLAPLVLTGRAAASPMQPVMQGRPILLECCPASFLKSSSKGLYQPYKGTTSAHRKQRQTILTALIEDRLLQPPPPALRAIILENNGGDALDAVIAAVIALKASADSINLRPRADRERQDLLEARVYF